MLLGSLRDYHIQHMFREGNKATYVLENLGVEEPEVREFDSVDGLPVTMRNIILQDKDSIPRQGIGWEKVFASVVS
ncbi:hypothetical protein SUGI_0836570 [Cryptomeria japonica]|nr:hypothetical protein SUGI_0836570 [Cryptomeria japonica]